MSAHLSIHDVLETAKQKLGGISACLNDSKAFAQAVSDFDVWLAEHSTQLASAAELNADTREKVADILRRLTRLEFQARHNAHLVSDMQSYLQEDKPIEPYAPKTGQALGPPLPPETREEHDGDNVTPQNPAVKAYAAQNQAIQQISPE
ncbi:MAG: hypothetical protein L7W39_09480 [Alphaproteobacteria bacterium]|nr:hypothetical protein [Alphaproteobacteria bacterium]